jgi:release factor glutamine methyltransferase
MTEEEFLATGVLNCSRTDLVTGKRVPTPDEAAKIEALKRRRASGAPLQYLIGFTEFMGLRLNVSPATLIPRPETEFLVEKIINYLKPSPASVRILDLGTGSGCIAISLANFLSSAELVAIDISEEALALAAANALVHRVDEKIEFFRASFQNFLYDNSRGQFDVIVANPPYIPTRNLAALPMDVQKEPRIALDGGEDGLTPIRTIIGGAFHRLPSGGLLAMEIGETQRCAIAKIFNRYTGYRDIVFEQDLTGRDRYVFAACPGRQAREKN